MNVWFISKTLTISTSGSGEPGNLQLLQTEQESENPVSRQRTAQKYLATNAFLKVLKERSLTSSGVMTPVSLNLDSCKGGWRSKSAACKRNYSIAQWSEL